jgi:NAD(P)-dependent dehydrogenase (short-subunit alcohol dehydrogenase family)
MKLNNKIAIITGGNSGIGLATAQAFIQEGAKVVIVGRNQQALDEALQTLGEQAIAVQADVANLVKQPCALWHVPFPQNWSIAAFASIPSVRDRLKPQFSARWSYPRKSLERSVSRF